MLPISACIVVFCFGLALVDCYPVQHYYQNPGGYYRNVPAAPYYHKVDPRSLPQQTMVYHGYYARPRSAGPYPESAMSAFASGETVQTGSAYLQPNGRGPCLNCQGDSYDLQPNVAPLTFDQNTRQKESAKESQNEIPETIEEQDTDLRPPNEPTTTITSIESTEPTTLRPQKPKPSKPRARKPVVIEDEEDDDEDEPAYNPFSGRRGSYPVYNSFFPMVFGGGEGFGGIPSARKRGSQQSDGQQRSGFPGATAIANSFSTGKGGVATSHATAYGTNP